MRHSSSKKDESNHHLRCKKRESKIEDKTLQHRGRLQITFQSQLNPNRIPIQSRFNLKFIPNPESLQTRYRAPKAETRSITRPRFFNVGWTDVTLPNPKMLVERDPNLSLLSALFGSFLSWLCSLLSSWFGGFFRSWLR